MRPDGNLVVTYHYVRPANSDGVIGITPQLFDRHLAEIARRFEIVHADDFAASHNRRRGMALVTFDDAVRDQYEFAAPVLDAHGVKVVFFAPMRPFSDESNRWCTQHLLHALAQELGWSELERRVDAQAGLIEIDEAAMNRLYHYELPRKRRLKYLLAFALPAARAECMLHQINSEIGLRADDWYMSRAQLLELQNGGHALGGHGFDHVPFTTLSPDQQAVEMHRAARTMNRLFGARPRAIAWPFGRFDQHTLHLARQCGYTMGLSTDDRTDARDLMAALERMALRETPHEHRDDRTHRLEHAA